MVDNDPGDGGGKVLPIFATSPAMPITAELEKIRAAVMAVCPRDSSVRFVFERDLRVQVDVRHYEDVAAIEALLPTLCGGIFTAVQRGKSAGHSFFHRVSARVDR